ncbi:phage tail protein [Pseudomonas chlororaphis]
MTDQNTQFYCILTAVGKAKQANATALGIPWTFAQMGVGDANGADPTPTEQQTQLINERRRAPLNQVMIDPNNANVIIAEQIIPDDAGPWWIRETGLYDAAGDLVAVGKCPPTYKPLLSQGSNKTQVIRMNLIVSNTANIELKIDPSVVLASRAYVDAKVLEEINKLDSKQSVRAATTANIALAGLQTVDGIALVAGDRVLVKNQAAAKDNGLYVAAAGAWARTTDADSNSEVTSAMLVAVEQGATLADTRWQLITDGTIVLGTTTLTFQNVTQGFAPINSPAFLGAPTAPTPARFDKTPLLATAEFVQLSKGGYSGFAEYQAASGSVPVTDVGKYIGFSSGGAQTYTLPDANTLPLGVSFFIEAVGPASVLTLTAPNTTFTGVGAQAPSSSFRLRDSACEFIVISGGSYRVVGGGGKSLVARNGYERMANGLIRMWGDGGAGGHASHCAFGNSIAKTIYNAFPIPFPNELFGVVANHNSAGVSTISIVTTGETVNGFYAAGSWSVDCSIRWSAIGR